MASVIAPDVAAMLARLGYDERWLRFGVLSEATLRAQTAAVAAQDGDPHCEHYRWGAFRTAVDRGGLDADAVRRLAELAETDPDVAAGAAMAVHLMHAVRTDDELREHVAAVCERMGSTRPVAQVRRMVRIERGDIDAALVEECLAARDGTALRLMASRHDLAREHLDRLAAAGPRAVRNIATMQLRRRA
jgi:hypothetical protein